MAIPTEELKALAGEIAQEFMREHPGAGHRSAADILCLAWYQQVQCEHEDWAAANKDRADMAKSFAKAANYEPDTVVAGHCGPAAICKTHRGDVVASGSMITGSVPLWVHFLDLADIALGTKAA